MQTFTTGDTQKLTAKFTDFDNTTLIDPDKVKVVIYDANFKVLDTYTGIEANKTSTGNYFMYYTPTVPGRYVVEWYGEKNNMPSVSRKWFSVENIVEGD